MKCALLWKGEEFPSELKDHLENGGVDIEFVDSGDGEAPIIIANCNEGDQQAALTEILKDSDHERNGEVIVFIDEDREFLR